VSDVDDIVMACKGNYQIEAGMWAFRIGDTEIFKDAPTEDDIVEGISERAKKPFSDVRMLLKMKGLKKVMAKEYKTNKTGCSQSPAKALWICNIPLREGDREKCTSAEQSLLSILDPIIAMIRIKTGATNEPSTVYFLNSDGGLEEWRNNPDTSKATILTEFISKVTERLREQNALKEEADRKKDRDIVPEDLYRVFAEEVEPIFKEARLVVPTFKDVMAGLLSRLLGGALETVLVKEAPPLLAWDRAAVVKLESKLRDSASDETPLFDSFCKRMNGDGDSFMAWVGAFFDPTATIRQVLWGHSDGQAGQSSFWTAFINGVLRPIVGILETRKHSSRFSTSMLVGKRLAYISETDERDFLKNPAVKRLTGKDFTRDERKGQDAKMVELWAQVAIIANIAPTVNTFDRAIMSRILYIKTSSLDNKEAISKEEIEETYKKEFWGIVKKCCAKWEKAKRNGAVDGIPLTDNNYRNLLLNCETNERKALREFIGKRLIYKEGAGVAKRDLFTHMSDYMIQYIVSDGNKSLFRNQLYRDKEDYLMIIQNTLRSIYPKIYVVTGEGSQDEFKNLSVQDSDSVSTLFIPMAGQDIGEEEILSEPDLSELDL
jgi:hypothetical protein